MAKAAALIRDERPDIVTLNEVCRHDVAELKRAMSSAHRNAFIVSAFKAAREIRTNVPYRCRNGQLYGIGVVARIATSASGHRAFGGVYPMQSRNDTEQRVWVCIDTVTDFYACTTHLSDIGAAIALAQCRYLFDSALPAMRSQGGNDPVILGADLNLPVGRSPGPQSCVPAGYQRTDDGSRQDIVASPGATLLSRAIIGMNGTTDHPGLLVELALPH